MPNIDETNISQLTAENLRILNGEEKQEPVTGIEEDKRSTITHAEKIMKPTHGYDPRQNEYYQLLNNMSKNNIPPKSAPIIVRGVTQLSSHSHEKPRKDTCNIM